MCIPVTHVSIKKHTKVMNDCKCVHAIATHLHSFISINIGPLLIEKSKYSKFLFINLDFDNNNPSPISIGNLKIT